MKRFYKRCIIQGYNGLDTAQISEAKRPALRCPGQVLVQVRSTSLNPLDKRMAEGYGQQVLTTIRKFESDLLGDKGGTEFPLVLGRDFSGEVVDTTCNNYKIGDEVFGASFPSAMGSHQEMVVADSSSLVHKPNSVKHSEASSIPYAGLTAWAALVTTGGILSSPKGSCRVLVLGAGGGVGNLAAQLALHHGAQVVSVAGSEYEEHISSTGAIYLNHKQDDYARNLIELSGFDIILDCAGFGTKSADLAPLLRARGCVVTLDSPLLKLTDSQGLLAGGVNSLCELLNSNLKTVGSGGQTVRWAYFSPNKQALQKLSDLLAGGELKPLVYKSYQFSNILQAYEEFQNGKPKGKIVINM